MGAKCGAGGAPKGVGVLGQVGAEKSVVQWQQVTALSMDSGQTNVGA